MVCEICGRGPAPEHGGITVYRQNEKGVKGIWRCPEHNTLPISPEIKLIEDCIDKLKGRPN